MVVDGSNIATEGRSTPSLRQLDDAVRQFQGEFPESEVIVVVDATFGHRIDKAERRAFEEAVAHGELVSPPAGAIGRGDAFVLRIAERVNGQVLSNDSFQEFHDTHRWLFEEGRLIGGKPVPKVGWIFTPRRPVRPPGRRGTRAAAVLDAVEVAAAEATEAATSRGSQDQALAAESSSPSSSGTRRRRRRRVGDPAVKAAIEVATEEAIGGAGPSSEVQPPTKRSASVSVAEAAGPQAVNDPLTFLTFISEHPLGAEVTGVVSAFVSHGAMVDVGSMHCYAPLSGLGDPAPKSARAVLHRGETRAFVLVALDPPRRGAQLCLPELAAIRGVSVDAVPGAERRPAKAAAVTSPTAPNRTSKASKAADSANTAKTAKAVKTEKTAKAANTTTTAKTTKASRTDKTVKTVKPAKSTKSAKSAKPANTTKTARPAKSAKPAKTAKRAEAPKGPKAARAGEPGHANTAPTASQRSGRARDSQ